MHTETLEMSVTDLDPETSLSCSHLPSRDELISLLSRCMRRDIEAVEGWFTRRGGVRPERSIHLIYLRLHALLVQGVSVMQATTEVEAWATRKNSGAGGY